MNISDASVLRWRATLRGDEPGASDRPLLYVITPADLRDPEYYATLVHAVARGGADIIQFRVKPDRDDPDDDWHTRRRAAARALVNAARTAGLMSVINDDPELAVDVDADAVHVGDDDASIATCKSMRSGTLIVGATARTAEAVHRAAELDADYVGSGPVFDARATKKNAAAPIGPAGLGRLCRAADEAGVPVVAIGGIDASSARSCVAVGARGVAVVRAVAGSSDPEYAARTLRQLIDEAARRS